MNGLVLRRQLSTPSVCLPGRVVYLRRTGGVQIEKSYTKYRTERIFLALRNKWTGYFMYTCSTAVSITNHTKVGILHCSCVHLTHIHNAELKRPRSKTVWTMTMSEYNLLPALYCVSYFGTEREVCIARKKEEKKVCRRGGGIL